MYEVLKKDEGRLLVYVHGEGVISSAPSNTTRGQLFGESIELFFQEGSSRCEDPRQDIKYKKIPSHESPQVSAQHQLLAREKDHRDASTEEFTTNLVVYV